MPQPKPPAPPPPPPTPPRLSSRRVSTRWVARACLLRLARPGPPRLLLPRPLRCLRDNRRSTAHRVLVARLQIRASTRTVPGARPLRPSGSAWPWVRSGSFCEVIIKVFRQEKTEMPQFLRIDKLDAERHTRWVSETSQFRRQINTRLFANDA